MRGYKGGEWGVVRQIQLLQIQVLEKEESVMVKYFCMRRNRRCFLIDLDMIYLLKTVL